jgi:glutamate formiminotransferase
LKILECVPNFSEGRDRSVIDRIVAEVRGVRGVKLLDVQSDPDHHRSVLTFLGESEAVERAALGAARKAVELIDMRQHKGSHPRLGAVDVVPFVPIHGSSMDDAIAAARRFGAALGQACQVPVYYYEEAATSEARRNLADVRRGGYEGLAARLADPAWQPDAGPAVLNVRSGATAVGARFPLIAFNVNLATDDLEVAKQVARAVRQSSGGLPYVRAMGVKLEERGLVQVSMNLVNHERMPIHRAVELIRAEARRYGVGIRECELVGLLPLGALEEVVSYYLQIPGFSVRQIIETALLPGE